MQQPITNRTNSKQFLAHSLLALLCAAGLLMVLSVGSAMAATDPCSSTSPSVGIVDDQSSLCVSQDFVTAAEVTDIAETGTITVNMHSQSTFTLPVSLASNGNSISSVEFDLTYPDSCVSYDSITDSDNDGIPDAIDATPNTAGALPEGFTVLTQFTAPDSVQILVKPLVVTETLPILSDGGLITFTFDVVPSCITNDGSLLNLAFQMANQHFGDDHGQEISGTVAVDSVDLRFNADPTDITLSNNAMNENMPTGTVIGQFDSIDVDETAPRPGDSHTYAFVDDVLPNGNINFTISGDQLLTALPFDFETTQGYSVTVRSTDSYGGMYTETLTLVISDVNEAPTDILVTGLTVNENVAAPTPITTLDATDEDEIDPGAPTDISENHSYLLPTGELDNANFQISGTTLEAAGTFNYEAKSSYNVMIRTTDSGGLMYTKTVTILVVNVNDAPVAVDDPASAPIIVTGDTTTTLSVLANDTDQDADGLSVSAVDSTGTPVDGAAGTITNNSSNVSYNAANANGRDTFTYTVTDDDTSALTDQGMVTVNVVKNDARGDCNGDGNINAADFPALLLEIFDTDETYAGKPAWWRIFSMGTPDFEGSPLGCDANATRNGVDGTAQSVQASDIICTVLVFFGNDSCTNEVATRSTQVNDSASLSIGTGLIANRGTTISVPVKLVTAGNKVAAATFAVGIDPAYFDFAAIDADNNGIPDAVTIQAPGMVKSVVYNAQLGRLEIAIYSATLPVKLLSDGTLATVQLTVREDISTSSAPVAILMPSLGNDSGLDVSLETSNGTVQVPDANGKQVFLPMVAR